MKQVKLVYINPELHARCKAQAALEGKNLATDTKDKPCWISEAMKEKLERGK